MIYPRNVLHQGETMNDQRIAVLTDTGSDCPEGFAEAHDVRVAPLRINYSDGSTYESGVDITTAEVVARFEQEVPKTSLPSPERIMDMLHRAKADGYRAAVFVSISSGLSATCDTVRMVARTMDDFPVAVVDTKGIGISTGLIVMEAVRQVEAGVPFSDLERSLTHAAKNTRVLFTVRDLEFLRKGGRISEAVYRVGSVLNIKPVLTCDAEGKYTIAKKARGWEKALDMEVSIIEKFAANYPKVRLGVSVTDACTDMYDVMEAKFRERVGNIVGDIERSRISPALLVHTGPTLVGCAVQGL